MLELVIIIVEVEIEAIAWIIRVLHLEFRGLLGANLDQIWQLSYERVVVWRALLRKGRSRSRSWEEAAAPFCFAQGC